MTKKYVDDLTYEIVGCAIEVHKLTGPGLLESVYEKCLRQEMTIRGLNFETQILVPVKYKLAEVNADLRLDALVENYVIVELKSIDGVLPVHIAQVLTYMNLLEKPKGILINFNCTNIFKEGQKTLVNEYYNRLPAN
jgi:GxxExxY protein